MHRRRCPAATYRHLPARSGRNFYLIREEMSGTILYETEPRSPLWTGFMLFLVCAITVPMVVLVVWGTVSGDFNKGDRGTTILIDIFMLAIGYFMFYWGYQKFKLKQIVVYKDKITFCHRLSADVSFPIQRIKEFRYFSPRNSEMHVRTYTLRLDLTDSPSKKIIHDIPENDCINICNTIEKLLQTTPSSQQYKEWFNYHV
jgi:hypothetical protein